MRRPFQPSAEAAVHMTKNDNNPLLRISQTRPQKGMFAEGDVCPVLTRKKKGCLVVAVVFGLGDRLFLR